MSDKKTVNYLRDLAERLMNVPPMYGTSAADIDRLMEIAGNVDEAKTNLGCLLKNPRGGAAVEDWPVANPGDADCLRIAYNALRN